MKQPVDFESIHGTKVWNVVWKTD